MDSESFEQETPYPLGVNPALGGHASAGALQYQLEAFDTVDRIKHIIKGEVEIKNATGQVVWVKKFPAMLNDKGLSIVEGYLSIYLGGTKTFALSDFGEDYICDEVIDVGRNVRAELMDNWTEYNVKDYASASFIINMVTAAVHAVLKKGQNATYLKFLRTTQTIQEIQQHSAFKQMQDRAPDKEDGLFNMIFKKRK